MKEIAAMDLGGSSEDYEIGGERVYRSDDNSIGLTYAQTAQRAIELGGKFDGTEYPEDINPLTQLAVQGVQGSGLIGVAKDNIWHKDNLQEISLDSVRSKWTQIPAKLKLLITRR